MKKHSGVSYTHIAALAALGLPLAGRAEAQQAASNEANVAATQTIAEVLVTATKRGEVSVQDASISITAFDAAKLERLDVLDFDDVIVHVPGANFLDNGGPGRGTEVASIRGLSPVGDNTASVVAQYLDGAPRFGGSYRLFDITEVSVLRGPQGTLWGAQAIGGLISFRSARPDPTHFDAEIELDSYATEKADDMSFRIGGHVNVPIASDTFAVRLAGHTIDEAGYIDNATAGVHDVNNVDESAWRISALWRPTEDLTVTALYHGGDLRADAPSFFDIALADRQSSAVFAKIPAQQRYDLFVLNLELDLGWGNLSYNGSRFDGENEYLDYERNAFGFIPLGRTVNTLDQRSWTHELRLSSGPHGALDWVVGVYYDDLDEIDTSIQRETALAGDPTSPTFGEGFEIMVLGGPQTMQELAVFGEVEYALTDRLSLLAGLRYFDWSVDNAQEFTYFGQNFQQATGEVGGDDVFKKVQLNYRPTDDVLLYLTRSEGFRFGGFNPFVGPALDIPERFIRFDPDTLTNYEAGFKTSWSDGRVLLNGSVYFMEWEKIQAVVRNQPGTFAFTANGPDLEARGAELELIMQGLWLPQLYVAASYAYTKNEFTSDASIFENVPQPPLVRKGDELRRTPRNTWSLDVGYDFTIGGRLPAFVRANYWHKDSTNTKGFNSGDGDIDVPAHDVVNASVGVTLDAWRLKLYVDNLTDKTPLLQIFPNATNPAEPAVASSIRPRTIGLQVSRRFGT